MAEKQEPEISAEQMIALQAEVDEATRVGTARACDPRAKTERLAQALRDKLPGKRNPPMDADSADAESRCEQSDGCSWVPVRIVHEARYQAMLEEIVRSAKEHQEDIAVKTGLAREWDAAAHELLRLQKQCRKYFWWALGATAIAVVLGWLLLGPWLWQLLNDELYVR